MPGWLLGIDIGGTGSRAALVGIGDGTEVDTGIGDATGARRQLQGEVVSVDASGSSVPEVARALVSSAAEAWPEAFAQLRGVAVGASGLASLVQAPERVPDALRETALAHGAPAGVRAAAAIDAVTAHLGALGGAAGAVVALGTGAIALGSDGHGEWRRVDGWGHLLGDRGGGAWIGLRGLELAMRAYDGVSEEGAALLHAAEARFGTPPSWPAQLYTRHDRAAVLAGFAPDVLARAQEGDAAAERILLTAGTEAACSAVAALGPDLPARVALTGGLAEAMEPLRDAFADTARHLRPEVEIVDPLGDPLDGAVRLAGRAAAHRLRACAPFVWSDSGSRRSE